ESVLSTMYSKIPYNNLTHIAKYEGYYVSVLYAYLLAIGMEIIGEEVTNKGRIDLTIKHLNKIYIMEFKLGEDDPLQQIKERKYYEKYMNAGKEIYIIGINFNSDLRNVSKVVWERIS
ncbi:MAG TPA: PD-(D/E)XK nuclease domain-containing protein, partial [Ignavibacteriales bacterium]|nr:PD-(D/E)XK nuclease domain-containing protein [Ignavibacteriales bacterium]